MVVYPYINLLAGWAGMLLGVISGAVLGLFFHREDWAGGYGSMRRRMMRLGHIAFFGLGFLNLLFEMTIHIAQISGPAVPLASWALILGAATMPICCFLVAWRRGFRHLFPVPVIAVAIGVVITLIALIEVVK